MCSLFVLFVDRSKCYFVLICRATPNTICLFDFKNDESSEIRFLRPGKFLTRNKVLEGKCLSYGVLCTLQQILTVMSQLHMCLIKFILCKICGMCIFKP